MKLNVDGYMHKSLLGVKGCIRGDHGNWCEGFVMFIGIGNIVQVELWAIYLDLQLAASHNIPKLEVESDSIIVVLEIKNNNLIAHPYQCLIAN